MGYGKENGNYYIEFRVWGLSKVLASIHVVGCHAGTSMNLTQSTPTDGLQAKERPDWVGEAQCRITLVNL